MENKFYVYEHATEGGEVFYVGKGTGDRAWQKTGRSSYWNNVARKHGRVVHIVRDGLSELEAFDIEKCLIARHGRRDEGEGTLVNLTPGGEGRSGQTEKGKWAQILESEGLGVIRPDREQEACEVHNSDIGGRTPDQTSYTVQSIYESPLASDSMWEALHLGHRATSKEAELADRRRASICGLDDRQRARSLTLKREPREPGKEWRARMKRHIIHTYA